MELDPRKDGLCKCGIITAETPIEKCPCPTIYQYLKEDPRVDGLCKRDKPLLVDCDEYYFIPECYGICSNYETETIEVCPCRINDVRDVCKEDIEKDSNGSVRALISIAFLAIVLPTLLFFN